MQPITPCLWFDGQAEAAAEFYIGIFPGARIINVTRFTEAGREFHGKPPGAVMTVEFELNRQRFTALNGGPQFQFNEAISFQVHCDTQEELDRIWERLSEGGDPEAQRCGWLKDRFGVSWQVVPTVLAELLKGGDAEQAKRVMDALLQMSKIDIETLRRAFEAT